MTLSIKSKKNYEFGNKRHLYIPFKVSKDSHQKELKSKEEIQKVEHERLIKKDENLILITNDLREKERILKLIEEEQNRKDLDLKIREEEQKILN